MGLKFISALIFAYAVARYMKKKEEKLLKDIQHGQASIFQHGRASEPHGSINRAVEKSRRIMFAIFIKEVYNMVEGKPYGQGWRAYGYNRIDLRELLKEDLRSRSDLDSHLKQEMEDRYFVVLRKDPAHVDPTVPDWMIVLRGTSSRRDWRNILGVTFETLQTSSTIILMDAVISRLVQTEGTDLSKLAITGHSLGAAMAMVVTRRFALERIFLNCHFFNPPYAAFIPMLREYIRKCVSPFVDLAKLDRKEIRNRLIKLEALISKKMNWIRDGGKKMRTQREEFIALADWSPCIYLNPKDVVCEQFIQHFFMRRLLAPLHEDIYRFYSYGSILRAILPGKTETFHLLPRARICRALTNFRVSDSHGVETWTRHDLPTRYDEVNLVSDEERMSAR